MHDKITSSSWDSRIGHSRGYCGERFRWENAKIDGFKGSNAVTLRTRLGYATNSYHGFMAYAGFENIVALKNNNYFDAIAPNSDNRTVIADPEATEVDRPT